MIQSVLLKLRIKCDSCDKTEEVEAWIPWWDLHVVLGSHKDLHLEEDQLPDLWEYYKSGGWGATDYTKTQLLCPDCVRRWREEGVLEHMARKAAEEKK